jgi:hypothetical protein
VGQKHVGKEIATQITQKFTAGVPQIVRISCKNLIGYIYFYCANTR